MKTELTIELNELDRRRATFFEISAAMLLSMNRGRPTELWQQWVGLLESLPLSQGVFAAGPCLAAIGREGEVAPTALAISLRSFLQDVAHYLRSNFDATESRQGSASSHD